MFELNNCTVEGFQVPNKKSFCKKKKKKAILGKKLITKAIFQKL